MSTSIYFRKDVYQIFCRRTKIKLQIYLNLVVIRVWKTSRNLQDWNHLFRTSNKRSIKIAN